ncbi:unnamed protein product [Albugo candida]|uniref:Uncharacterized protein n=1 Tax=Albugo candida TaxID=65357 RepID=A0A024GKK3_9STRA|nr:unnamed protein product [Albugo candida]|eukprot:CCI47264.1 unnamed protein product [Albugo candida]
MKDDFRPREAHFTVQLQGTLPNSGIYSNSEISSGECKWTETIAQSAIISRANKCADFESRRLHLLRLNSCHFRLLGADRLIEGPLVAKGNALEHILTFRTQYYTINSVAKSVLHALRLLVYIVDKWIQSCTLSCWKSTISCINCGVLVDRTRGVRSLLRLNDGKNDTKVPICRTFMIISRYFGDEVFNFQNVVMKTSTKP